MDNKTYDLCPKDNSRYVNILKFRKQNPNVRDRNHFWKKDVDLLWTTKDIKWFQIPLMLIYAGVRIFCFICYLMSKI